MNGQKHLQSSPCGHSQETYDLDLSLQAPVQSLVQGMPSTPPHKKHAEPGGHSPAKAKDEKSSIIVRTGAHLIKRVLKRLE